MANYLFYTDPFFWGVFLVLAIPYWAIFLSIKMNKFKVRVDYEKWLNIAGILIGSFIGLLTLQEDYISNMVGGAFLYGLVMILLFREILEYFLVRIVHMEETGTPINKLKLDKEYIELLKNDNVFTIEELKKRDLKELSEGTGLTVETLIKIRKRI